MSQRTNSSKGLILPSIDFAIKVVTPGMCIIIMRQALQNTHQGKSNPSHYFITIRKKINLCNELSRVFIDYIRCFHKREPVCIHKALLLYVLVGRRGFFKP